MKVEPKFQAADMPASLKSAGISFSDIRAAAKDLGREDLAEFAGEMAAAVQHMPGDPAPTVAVVLGHIAQAKPTMSRKIRSGPKLSNRDQIAAARKAREAGTGNQAADLGIVKKPSKIKVVTKVSGWFRSHPEFCGEFEIFQPKVDDGPPADPMFIGPDAAAPFLAGEDPAVRTVRGWLAQTRAGANLLLALPVQTGDRPLSGATEAKVEAAEEAVERWTKMAWKQASFEYEISYATNITAEPRWPEFEDFDDLLAQAFGSNCIWDYDATVLRRYRGEI